MSETADRIRDGIIAIASIEDHAEREHRARELAEEAHREFDVLDTTNDELQAAIDEAKDEAEGKTGEIADAAHAFFDEINRPVGQLRFIVPETDAVNRALLNLHDAVERRL